MEFGISEVRVVEKEDCRRVEERSRKLVPVRCPARHTSKSARPIGRTAQFVERRLTHSSLSTHVPFLPQLLSGQTRSRATA
jgi:hypothetical protein